VTEPSEKANILNDHFMSVYTVDSSDTIPNMGTSPHVTMDNIEISQQDVLNLLLNHESHKSPGPDGIGALFLKNTAYEIAPWQHIYFSNRLSLMVLSS